eukprot:GHVS01095483.1.p1 GENE.GHVS01095483.1~~GHVS01095483.1.p1  ORF type:complete len:518 (-),score=110.28 GHVS01095483.1:343-1896(-)
MHLFCLCPYMPSNIYIFGGAVLGESHSKKQEVIRSDDRMNLCTQMGAALWLVAAVAVVVVVQCAQPAAGTARQPPPPQPPPPQPRPPRPPALQTPTSRGLSQRPMGAECLCSRLGCLPPLQSRNRIGGFLSAPPCVVGTPPPPRQPPPPPPRQPPRPAGRPAEGTQLHGIAPPMWRESSPCVPSFVATEFDETRRRNNLWMSDIPKRYLGSSLMEVSPISLGTMTFGEQTSEEEAHNLLDLAVKDCGINLLDMAEMYPAPPRVETNGHTESIVGRWLQKNPGWRERIYIATKISGPAGGGGTTNMMAPPLRRCQEAAECFVQTHHPDSLLQSCEGSLRRLQTDYIDLYQLHWPARRVPLFGHTLYKYAMGNSHGTAFEDICTGIKVLFEKGKIRNWGLSNETPFGLAELVKYSDLLGIPRPVSIQTSLNLLHRAQFEDSLVESCAPHNYNVGLLAWSPLAGGMLTGKYLAAKTEESTGGHPNNNNRCAATSDGAVSPLFPPCFLSFPLPPPDMVVDG